MNTKDWSEQFDLLTDIDHYSYDSHPRPVKDSLFGTKEYPESKYELDADKIKSFIRELLAKQREECIFAARMACNDEETENRVVEAIKTVHDVNK